MTLDDTRQWLSTLFLVVLLAGGVILVGACGEGNGDGEAATAPAVTEQPAPANPTTPPDTPTTVPPTEAAAPVGATAETLAAAGQEVYTEHCVSCHGEQGEGGIGPALMGERAHLEVFGTADALYGYVHRAMPQTAPGSLSDEQYLEVVTFLLLENEYVEPDMALSIEGLGQITLE